MNRWITRIGLSRISPTIPRTWVRLQPFTVAKETKGRLDLGFGRGAYEGLTVYNYTLMVGVFRAVHELWSAQVDVGGRYTTSRFDVLGQQQESTDTGWVGDASVTYTGERTNASFTFSSNIAPAYGYTGAVLRTTGSSTCAAGSCTTFRDPLGGVLLEPVPEGAILLPDHRRAVRDAAARVPVGGDKAYRARRGVSVLLAQGRIDGGISVQNYAYASATLSYPFFDE